MQKARDNACEEASRAGLIPASTFLAVRKSDGHLVGTIHIRHRLNPDLTRSGGQIGYSVRRFRRRKGYAGQMLRLALDKCRALGLTRVLLTCDRGNTASERTMQGQGAVLRNEVAEEGKLLQRYWSALWDVALPTGAGRKLFPAGRAPKKQNSYGFFCFLPPCNPWLPK